MRTGILWEIFIDLQTVIPRSAKTNSLAARVIFAETEKFDGRTFRTINTAEINQIGGRAGRYGLNEYGEVLVFGNNPIIGEMLGKRAGSIRASCIAFPREVLSCGYPIALLLKTWQKASAFS